MKNKSPKKYSITDEIYFSLFGFKNGYKYESQFGFDIGFKSVEIDLTETSRNLDFEISTYQSKDENIYFNVSLLDYDTAKKYDCGFFYIKDNRGEINAAHLQALALIIAKGNEITDRIFREGLNNGYKQL